MTKGSIFFLTGHAGVGKLTVAREIASQTGAKIIDNHYVNNPIFHLVELYRKEPLPEVVWQQVDAVRAAILETVATISPKEWSFVFTHVGLDTPRDIGVYHAIRDCAARRGSKFQPAALTCDIDVHVQRIDAPGRRERLKDVSPENARVDSLGPLLAFDEASSLRLDITHLEPTEAARQIVAAGTISN